MPCYAWIRGECKLGDKCRFEHDPKSAPKTGGADDKGKGKGGKGKGRRKEAQVEVTCVFTHSKADPSKGDLEVQRRIAEKKAKESSGRDAAAGVVLGGDRPKVMLAPVEESADAETEEWIWNAGAALDVASAAVAGK